MALPGQAGFLDAAPDVPEQPTRSWGRAALDTALTAGEFIPETAKALTTVGRLIAPDPHGLAADADRIANRALEAYRGLKSERAHQIEQESYLPGVDEPSAYGDIGAKAGETVASAIPFILGGWAEKLPTATLKIAGRVMEKAGVPIMGLTQFGSYANQIRKFTDDTSVEDLNKDPVIGPQWRQALSDAKGDELVARETLFNKAFDAGSAVANAAAGAAGGAALGRKFGLTSIRNLPLRVGATTAEGAAVGAAMGGAGAYGGERTDVNLGRKTAIDTAKIERGMAAGAIPMAAMTGPMSMFQSGRAEKVTEDKPPADQEVALKTELPQIEGPPDLLQIGYTPGGPSAPPGPPRPEPPPIPAEGPPRPAQLGAPTLPDPNQRRLPYYPGGPSAPPDPRTAVRPPPAIEMPAPPRAAEPMPIAPAGGDLAAYAATLPRPVDSAAPVGGPVMVPEGRRFGPEIPRAGQLPPEPYADQRAWSPVPGGGLAAYEATLPRPEPPTTPRERPPGGGGGGEPPAGGGAPPAGGAAPTEYPGRDRVAAVARRTMPPATSTGFARIEALAEAMRRSRESRPAEEQRRMRQETGTVEPGLQSSRQGPLETVTTTRREIPETPTEKVFPRMRPSELRRGLTEQGAFVPEGRMTPRERKTHLQKLRRGESYPDREQTIETAFNKVWHGGRTEIERQNLLDRAARFREQDLDRHTRAQGNLPPEMQERQFIKAAREMKEITDHIMSEWETAKTEAIRKGGDAGVWRTPKLQRGRVPGKKKGMIADFEDEPKRSDNWWNRLTRTAMFNDRMGRLLKEWDAGDHSGEKVYWIGKRLREYATEIAMPVDVARASKKAESEEVRLSKEKVLTDTEQAEQELQAEMERQAGHRQAEEMEEHIEGMYGDRLGSRENRERLQDIREGLDQLGVRTPEDLARVGISPQSKQMLQRLGLVTPRGRGRVGRGSEEEANIRERERAQHGLLRVEENVSHRLVEMGAIDKDVATELGNYASNPVEWRGHVQIKLGRELGQILRNMGTQLPGRRGVLKAQAEAVETGGRYMGAIQHVLQYVGQPEVMDRLSPDLQNRIADWMLKRTVADHYLGQPPMPAALPEKPQRLRKRPPPGVELRLLKPATEEERVGKPSQFHAEGLADWITNPANRDYVMGQESPYVQKSWTSDWLKDRKWTYPDLSPLDEHLFDIAGKTISDVPIHELHPEVMDAVLKKVGGPENARGYYDYKTDQIYLRKGATDAVVKEEMAHAIQMGALEHDVGRPQLQAIGRIGNLIDAKRNLWTKYGLRNEDVAHWSRYTSDPHELVAAIWHDEDFRRALAGMNITTEEKARIAAPRATNVLQAVVDRMLEAVKKFFNRVVRPGGESTVLNELLTTSMDVMGRAVHERPGYKEGQRTGAASVGDWLEEAGVRAAKKTNYLWNHGRRDLGMSKAANLFKFTNLLPEQVSADVRPYFHRILDVMNRSSHEAKRIVEKERATYEHAKELKDFERLYGDKAREAWGFLNDVTIHEADPSAPLSDPINKHVDANDPYWTQTVHRHGPYMERYKALTKAMPGDASDPKNPVPGFADLYKKHVQWHKTTRVENLRAQVFNAVDRDDLTHNADGSRNAVAREALTKLTMDSKAALTPAEDAWRQSVSKKELKDAISTFRAQIPDFHNVSGPYFPLKRFGGIAAYGEYKFLPTKTGKEIEPGLFEFTSPEDRKAYIIDHTENGPGTKTRAVYDVVVDKKTGEASEVTPREFKAKPAEYPDQELRHRVRLQKKYFATFENKQDAQEHIDLLRSNPHLTVEPEPTHVRDFSTTRNPEYIDQAMGAAIRRVKGSDTFAKMTPAEQKEVIAQFHQAQAKQVQLAGGRTPGLTRDYVQGASLNYVENFLSSAYQNAFSLARARHGDQFRDAIDAAKDAVQERRFDKGTGRRQDVLNEMLTRAYQMHDPVAHGWLEKTMNNLTSMTYQSDLSGPSFLAMNLTEPMVQAYPALAAQVGHARASAIMLGAYRDIGLSKMAKFGFWDMVRAAKGQHEGFTDYAAEIDRSIDMSKSKDKANEKRLFKDLIAEGFLDPDSINRVSLLRSENDGKLTRAINYGHRMFSGMNNAVEVTNRMAEALMFFRGTEGSYEDRLRAAKQAIYKFAGKYDQFNSPPATNVKLLAPMMQYKKYPIRVLSNYIMDVVGSLSHIDPALREPGREADLKAVLAERSLQRRRLAYTLGMQALVAGAFGLPTEVFSIPVNALWLSGATDTNWDDILDMGYKSTAEMAGPEAAEIFAHGALRYLNLGIGDRLALNNAILFGTPASRKPDDVKVGLAGILLGASGQHALRWGRGIQEVGEAVSDYAAGAPDRANMKLLSAARDLQFVRIQGDITDAIIHSMPDTSPRTMGGALMGPEWSNWDVFLRSLGVQSADVARAGEAKRAEARYEKRASDERKTWLERYAMADPATRQQVLMGIKEYNDSVAPEERIKQPELYAALNRRRKQAARPGSEAGLPITSRTRPTHEQYERLYNVPQ